MRKNFSIVIFILFFISIGGIAIGSSAPGSRMIKEIVGPEQDIKWAKGLPVIISKKLHSIAITPENMFTELKAPVEFTLVLVNPTEKPWQFLIKDVKAYSGNTDLEILGSEKIIAEARKEFSEKEYKISPKDKKALAPYIEDKMQILRNRLLKPGTIPPGGKIMGLIAITVPKGTETLTVEVNSPGESNKFNFNVMEIK